MVSPQQLSEDPSVSEGLFNNKYSQNYQSINVPTTYSTDYNNYYSQNVQNYRGDSSGNYTNNNSAYDTSNQALENVNGGYRDNTVLDYGAGNNFQIYGKEYAPNTLKGFVDIYNSQNVGSPYSNNMNSNGQNNYDSGSMYSAYNAQNFPDTRNTQVYGNSQYLESNSPETPSMYQYKIIQSRFHPTTYEEDSHAGEVVEPSVPDPSRPVASHNFQPQTSDSLAMASDSVAVQSLAPEKEQLTPPPLPTGYDYQPAPPPLPPPPLPPPPPVQGSSYYYYPPPRFPSNQYLPAPTAPPPPPPPDSATQERQVDYTYYYLGPKLWYVPLFFSIYFVLYVGALIIKAISKHKILFPQQLYNAATTVYTGRDSTALDLLTAHVTRALTNAAVKYLKRS